MGGMFNHPVSQPDRMPGYIIDPTTFNGLDQQNTSPFQPQTGGGYGDMPEPEVRMAVMPPGYTSPQQMPDMPQQSPQSDPGEYYQQMRQGIQSLDQVLKQLEGMQTPGGQYQGGGQVGMFGGGGGNAGK